MNISKILILSLMSLFVSTGIQASERCDSIARGMAGKTYEVTLVTNVGDTENVGQVSFAADKTSCKAYVLKAKNLQVIGDVLLPGAPKKVEIRDDGAGGCSFVGIGKIESNTLGSIVEGEDLLTFSVIVEDETYEHVAFSAK